MILNMPTPSGSCFVEITSPTFVSGVALAAGEVAEVNQHDAENLVMAGRGRIVFPAEEIDEQAPEPIPETIAAKPKK